MKYDIEYQVIISFRYQGLKNTKFDAFYNYQKVGVGEIDKNYSSEFNFMKEKGFAQKLRVVASTGESTIDLTQRNSQPVYSGGGVLTVEVNEVELPGNDENGGEFRASALDRFNYENEDTSGRDSCNCKLI